MKTYADTVDDIEIDGSPAFILQTTKALGLIKAAHDIDLIRPYIGIIREAERSGMRAYDAKPTYEVGRATWSNTLIWYASSIAHDSYHSKLYQEAKKALVGGGEPDASTWTGAEAERQCLAFQLKVLQDMGADKSVIDYIAELQKNPTYQGDPKSKADYERRSW